MKNNSIWWRFLLLVFLFAVFFISGAAFVTGYIPDIESEPGLVSGEIGLIIISVVNTLIIMALILSSNWNGWKLALGLSFAYYGVVTFVMQVETWFFLSEITVDSDLLFRLFLMGLPVAFIFIPLAVVILGKWRSKENIEPVSAQPMPVKQWMWKLVIIAACYVVLYWLAGYYIAWQNPDLRAFYGSPGVITPFWEHTATSLREDPGLFLLQIARAGFWTICALPIIYGSKLSNWGTAILVGIFFSIPQNISHILENPLMPIASIRHSHMIETALSTFIFGLIIVWLLHRKHDSARDLFAMDKVNNENFD